MNRNLIRISSAIIGLILLTVIVLGLSGERGAASQANQTLPGSDEPVYTYISHRIAAPLSESSSSSIWTRERMLAAQPYPLETIAGEPAVSLELSRPDGPPGVIASSPPGIEYSSTSSSTETLETSQATTIGYNYPPPYARYQNFDSYQTYPYSTVGVMFFKQGEAFFRCSAASIGNYAIWTRNCLPRARATVYRVRSVTDGFSGSSNRSSEDLLVCIMLASVLLEMLRSAISF